MAVGHVSGSRPNRHWKEGNMRRSTLSQEELQELEMLSKWPKTPIHIGEPVTDEQWRRFVFFENIKDVLLIIPAVIGFLLVTFYVAKDLTQQHGIAVPISILVGVAVVLITSVRRRK